MKIQDLRQRFVTNKKETLDFKAFCKGGSPEYVAAKQKLNDLHLKHQQNSRRNLTAYSLVINPLAFFDLNFMIAAGAVVVVAVLERKLAENGIGFAAFLSGFLHIAFPVIAFGSILFLISKLGVFL